MIVGVILSVLFIFTILLLVFLRKRINVAIEVLKVASRAVIHVKSSVIFPIVPVLAQGLLLACGLVVAVYLASAAQPAYRTSLEECDNYTCITPGGEKLGRYEECKPEGFNCTNCEKAWCLFFQYKSSTKEVWAHYYNGFMTIWCMLFSRACAELVLAGAFASWYFVRDKKRDMPRFILIRSIARTLRYHAGTAAFGSLLLALIKALRLFFEYIDDKINNVKKKSPFIEVMSVICRCCLWCFEK